MQKSRQNSLTERGRPHKPSRRLVEILKQVNLVPPEVELPALSEELTDLNDDLDSYFGSRRRGDAEATLYLENHPELLLYIRWRVYGMGGSGKWGSDEPQPSTIS